MSDQAAQQPEIKLPGSLVSGWLIARLFFRVTLGRKRIIWIGLLMLAPVAMGVYWRIAESGSGLAFFTDLTVNVLLSFFALGLPLYLGVSAIRDEIDDRTIVYLFARPLHRAVIIGGKIVSVFLVVTVVLLVDLALVYLVVVSADGAAGLGAGWFRLVRAGMALVLAAAVYTALFSLIGVVLRRPMLLAIMVGAGWELTVSNLPAGFPRMTLMYYLKSTLSLGPEAEGVIALLIPPIPPAPMTDALATLLGAGLLLFAAALLIGARKEYRL